MKWWNLLLLDNFLGMGVSPSHLPIHSCSSFQPPENARDNQKNLKKKKEIFPWTILGLIYISFLAARLSGMSACCNSVNKSNLQFSGHTFFYKQSVGDLTLAQFLKHVIIPQKRQVLHYKYSKTPH